MPALSEPEIDDLVARLDDQRERIADLEAAFIRIAALAYSYNAETPDRRFVEIGEAARAAAGEAVY